MKKYILVLFIIMFPFSCLAHNIDFELYSDLYTSVIKKENDNKFIFELNNNINSINVNKSELKKILGQKSNSNDPLAVYSVLKIDSDFDGYYLGINSGWVPDAFYEIKPNQYVELKNDDILIYNYSITYKDNHSYWKTSVPENFDGYNLNLEEKLALLLNINKEDVIKEYGKLYKFRVLPSGYINKMRIDFYKEKEKSLPIQISNGVYLSKSLDFVDTKYLVIKYNRIESMETLSILNKKDDINVFSLFLFLLTIFLTIVLYKRQIKKV